MPSRKNSEIHADIHEVIKAVDQAIFKLMPSEAGTELEAAIKRGVQLEDQERIERTWGIK